MSAEPVRDDDDLRAILRLQRQNLKTDLSREEADSQGFLTVEHSLELLQRMHALAPSIVVRAGSELAGYALVMPLACRDWLPMLVPMFDRFASLTFRDRPLPSLRFYVMGQICVARDHRGRGVFDALYRGHAELYRATHDLVVTEVSVSNQRSMRAHERVGFVEIDRQRDATDQWSIVAWDFA